MRQLIAVAHISLDGFVAFTDGSLAGFAAGQDNLEFVCGLTHHADAALFGRISYQLLDSYWPGAKALPNATKGEIEYSIWYNAATKIVLSKTLQQTDAANTIIIGDNVAEEIRNIKQQPGKDILIFGSPKAFQSLAKYDLIDEYAIFVNPVIFGKGIPLFDGSTPKTKLKLSSTKQFPNGEIALHYKVE
jgi:dihydrofolate reductase